MGRPDRKRRWKGGIIMNDNLPPAIMIITGRARRQAGAADEGVHVLLAAPDDDSAVRAALEALASEGYGEAELDQIGELEGQPDDEPHRSAWQGAVEGDVSIITFDDPDDA
jgi:hypothetical protein